MHEWHFENSFDLRIMAKNIIGVSMHIPIDQIPPDALQNLLEDFVTRYDSDHRFDDASLQERVDDLKANILNKKLFICFDEESETFSLNTKETL